MKQVGDVYEFAIRQTYFSQTLYNVLHFKLKAVPADMQVSCLNVADDIKVMMQASQENTLAYAGWKATQVAGNGITYDAVNCRRSGGDFYEGVLSATAAGTSAGNAPGASYAAIVIALKTGISGRSRRGQIYIGGLDVNGASTADRNKVDATVKSTLEGRIATFYAKYKESSGTSTDWEWVVFSRLIASGCKYVITGNKPTLTHVQAGDQANASTYVASAVVRDYLAPMNRRKVGVGI